MASQPEPSWVLRFSRTERVGHWVQALTFLTLLATGLMISIAQLEALIGHRSLLREIHLASAFFFVFAPALVALAGSSRSVFADAEEVDRWTGDDARWLTQPATDPTPWTPPAGKFNAGQKLNAIFTLYSTFAFALTGLILWQNRRFPFEVVSQANLIHTYLAYIALGVYLGHIYLAAISRPTRPSLHGMIFGTVRRDWAQYHHPKWRFPREGEAPLTVSTVVRSIALFVLGLEAALLLTRALLEWLGANTTDAVTNAIYVASALPATLTHQVTGVRAVDLGALIWAGLAAAIWLAVRRRDKLLPDLAPSDA